MNTILKAFGINVEYIWIHPGESVRFMKTIEKRIGGEIKKVTEYIVHAKLHGYHITGSPITISLVEESGVDLKEIQGKFELKSPQEFRHQARSYFTYLKMWLEREKQCTILPKFYTAESSLQVRDQNKRA